MTWLIIVAIVSLSGALFMLGKKIYEIQPHIENAGSESHTNFIFDFWQMLKGESLRHTKDTYHKVRPHAHDLVSYFAAKMYKLSSWSAQEFLRFYNFIQGRKELRGKQTTSSFLTDITRHKEQTRAGTSRKGVYQANRGEA